MRNVTARICGDPPPNRSALVPEDIRYKSPIPIPELKRPIPIMEYRNAAVKFKVDRDWQSSTYSKIKGNGIKYTEVHRHIIASGYKISLPCMCESIRGLRGARPELMSRITDAVDYLIAHKPKPLPKPPKATGPYQRGSSDVYSDEENQMIVAMWNEGKSANHIASMCYIKFGTTRTRSAICGKASRGGLARRWKK